MHHISFEAKTTINSKIKSDKLVISQYRDRLTNTAPECIIHFENEGAVSIMFKQPISPY